MVGGNLTRCGQRVSQGGPVLNNLVGSLRVEIVWGIGMMLVIGCGLRMAISGLAARVREREGDGDVDQARRAVAIYGVGTGIGILLVLGSCVV